MQVQILTFVPVRYIQQNLIAPKNQKADLVNQGYIKYPELPSLINVTQLKQIPRTRYNLFFLIP